MSSKMKTCGDYRTVLTDAAAAAVEPSLELRSHLDACASCRAAFAEETQLFAAIDSGLRSAANAEVPVSLLPRVRVQLNEQRVPHRTWIPAGAAMAAAVAIFAVIVFVRGFGRDSASRNPAENPSAHSDAPVQIQPAPPVVASTETTSPPTRIKRRRADKAAPSVEPVQAEVARVLIPAGQKRAMDAWLVEVRQGRVKADVLLAGNSEKALEELQVPPIDISPIEMKPLVDVSAESGSENEKTRR